jgi:hypothetical protein
MPAVQNTFKAELIKHYHRKYELRVSGDVTEPTTGWTVSSNARIPGYQPERSFFLLWWK